MNEIVDQHNAIVEAFKRIQPLDVVKHGGRLTPEDIKRRMEDAPAAFVTYLGGPVVEQGSRVKNTILWVVAIMTKDDDRDVRIDQLSTFILAASSLVTRQTWNLDCVSVPRDISTQNLYSVQLDKMGCALAVIQWEQDLSIEKIEESALDDLNLIHGEFSHVDGTGDAAPEIESEQAL
jgi:hypothetical protein